MKYRNQIERRTSLSMEFALPKTDDDFSDLVWRIANNASKGMLMHVIPPPVSSIFLIHFSICKKRIELNHLLNQFQSRARSIEVCSERERHFMFIQFILRIYGLKNAHRLIFARFIYFYVFLRIRFWFFVSWVPPEILFDGRWLITDPR